jgi:hypothetical protein
LYYALEALGVGSASARSALDCASAICFRGRRRSRHARLRETEEPAHPDLDPPRADFISCPRAARSGRTRRKAIHMNWCSVNGGNAQLAAIPGRRGGRVKSTLWVCMGEGGRQQIETGCAGLSDDPEGPAAVLGISISSPALASPRSSLGVYGPTLVDLGGPVWFERNYNSLCGCCRGAEVRDLWIPLSFRPQSAQEPFSCFRATPGCDKFGDDVPPE